MGTLSANTVPHSHSKQKTTTPLRSKTPRKNQYPRQPQQPQQSTKKTQTAVTQKEEQDEVKVASSSDFPETFQFLARIRPLTPDEQIQPQSQVPVQTSHHHHHVAPIGRRPIIPTTTMTTSPNHKQKQHQHPITAVRFDDTSLWMMNHNSNSKYGNQDRCQVDGVMGMNTSQAQVYDACGLSQHLSEIYTKHKNIAIVVAGDNRTGKSYTTSGGWTMIQEEHSQSDTCDGLLPRCVNELFVHLHKHKQQKQQQVKNIGLEMSFQQLSLDDDTKERAEVQDLIHASSSNNDASSSSSSSSSSWKSVASPPEVISILQQAAEQREALAELFGQRAHLICRFRVVPQNGGGGMLTLINLAGGRSSNDNDDELLRNKKKEYEDGPADDRQDLQFLKRLVEYHHQSEISKSTSCSDELNELFESMTAGKYIPYLMNSYVWPFLCIQTLISFTYIHSLFHPMYLHPTYS